ncbi:MAG: hypothetical protein K0R34_3937 [Herbinix sp.]|jgi:GrpB-like predicted nucleotidyltransferase (UPF0157 family)|nr:hypothetical protein [Herbinix sp.]
MKELSEMTLEELWELFPIILTHYNLDYPKWYELEKESLLSLFNDGTIVRISHIGSTAVPGIISKPTIDILLELSKQCDITLITDRLKANEWNLMNSVEEPFFWQSYNKGYTKYGFADKVYHLHVRHAGDWNELYFRDYLIEHPEIAEKYAVLKRSLKERYEHNRDAYTEAKEEFVLHYSDIAKKLYGGRYQPDVDTFNSI